LEWTPKQIQILRDKFERVSWTELKGLFPDVSKEVIYKKARTLGLNRSGLSTSKGRYLNYALCHRDGRILRYEIIWKKNTPTCPRCGRRLRLMPRVSEYKGEKRIELRT
jgi:DNA-directed RNA polymerase subunit RPC12/RpoP